MPAIDEDGFRSILRDDLGIDSGSVVFAHVSVNGLHLGFPFPRILNLLLERVGPRGTLLFPCSQLRGRAAPRLSAGLMFDPAREVTQMGIIPELARRHAGAVRSQHPTNSVVAIGPLAEELTRDHHKDPYPCGSMSPYYRIVEHDGLIVGLGTSTRVLTFVHCVEDLLKAEFPVQVRESRLYEARVRWHDDKDLTVATYAHHRRTRHRDVPGFIRRHISNQVAQDLRCCQAEFFRARARLLFERMEYLARRGVTIYRPWAYRRHPLSNLID